MGLTEEFARKAEEPLDSNSLETFEDGTVNSTTSKLTSNLQPHHYVHYATTRQYERGILSVKNCASKEILPPLARKLAKAATLTAVLLQPVKDVFNNIEDKIDMVEIACSPTSILTNVFDENGHRCLRINRMSGYDLDTKAGPNKLKTKLETDTLKFGWVSLPCTRLSPPRS